MQSILGTLRNDFRRNVLLFFFFHIIKSFYDMTPKRVVLLRIYEKLEVNSRQDGSTSNQI